MIHVRRYYWEFCGEGASSSNNSGVIRTGDSLVISVSISSEPLEVKLILLCGVMKCFIGFPVTLKCSILNDLQMPFYAKNLFSSSVSLDFSASLSETICENELRYFNTANVTMFAGDQFLAM